MMEKSRHLFLVTLRLTILKQSSLPLQLLIRKKAPPLLLKHLQKEQLTKELSASLSLEEHPSLQVLSIDMAKGLEFDNVILHNPNVNRYSDNKRDKKSCILLFLVE